MHDSNDDDYLIARDRPRRDIKRPRRYSEVDLVAYALTVTEETNEGGEPQTYFEAISCQLLQSGFLSCMKKLNLSTRMILRSW